MSFFERYENSLQGNHSPPLSDLPVRVTCITNYLKSHGLRLGKIIGEGSYSKVRLCICCHSNSKEAGGDKFIACKIINKRKASDDFVHKFLPRELDIVGRLSNPNIITVFDVVEFDLHVFILMDFCSRGDLLEFIKKKGFLSEKRSQNYFYQILSAVRYLHGLDLAHRDLKCENVLLCSNDIVKISDFGFSRYCHDETGKRILSNTYCGSAAYAAPEILQGTKYNPKLYDMWSLGCILFIMLTGHMPYDESNVQQMLQNQTDRTLTYPHQVEGLISKLAKRLIRHLLEPDVTRRATVEHALSNPWFVYLKSKTSKSSTKTSRQDVGGGDFKILKHVHDTLTEEVPLITLEASCQDWEKLSSRPISTHKSAKSCLKNPPSGSSKGWPEEYGECKNKTEVKDRDKSSTLFNPPEVYFKEPNYSRETRGTRKPYKASTKHSYI